VYPILFKIGGLTFYTHGVLAVLGIVVCAIIMDKLARGEHLDRTLLFDNIVWSILIGIIGARITYFLLYRDQFTATSQIFYLQNGGLVSFGGFIPAALVFYLLWKYQKQPVAKWFDILSVGFAAGMVLGRLGNLMAGEYAGVASGSRLAIAGVLPINVFEGIWVAIVAIILYLIYRRTKNKIDGIIAWMCVFLYGLGRFVIDFWRDEKIIFWHLNLSQITSLILALIAAIIIMKAVIVERKK